MPSSAVMMKPPGSRPGIKSFATTPTINPKTIQPSMPNMVPPRWLRSRSRKPQDLPRFDEVGIAELILVDIENLHVVVGIAEMVFRDAAQRITGLDRVGLARR